MSAPDPEAGAAGAAVLEFVAVMRRLRSECAWKREQTHRSLQRFLIEETYETLEAIDQGAESGEWAHLQEELGDLLLQVVFHALIAEESGNFDLDAVARGITEKMIRRNAHVFGDSADPADSAELDPARINDLWQQTKAAERPDGPAPLPPGLPALLYADKMVDRRERAGQPVSVDPASSDVGDRLLALVAEARQSGIDPEQALRDAVRRLG